MKKLHQLSHRTLVKTCIALQKREEFLANRVGVLEEVLKSELSDKRELKKRIEALESEQAHRAMQLEHSDQLALDAKRTAKREAQKFLLAATAVDRFRGGVKRIREMLGRAMASAWADAPDGGPSWELEAVAGAVESLSMMPAEPWNRIEPDARASSREQVIHRES